MIIQAKQSVSKQLPSQSEVSHFSIPIPIVHIRVRLLLTGIRVNMKLKNTTSTAQRWQVKPSPAASKAAYLH